MASEIQYRCDFCRNEIVNNSVNKEYQGWAITYKSSVRRATHQVRDNLAGSHICTSCVFKILEHEEFPDIT